VLLAALETPAWAIICSALPARRSGLKWVCLVGGLVGALLPVGMLVGLAMFSTSNRLALDLLASSSLANWHKLGAIYTALVLSIALVSRLGWERFRKNEIAYRWLVLGLLGLTAGHVLIALTYAPLGQVLIIVILPLLLNACIPQRRLVTADAPANSAPGTNSGSTAHSQKLRGCIQVSGILAADMDLNTRLRSALEALSLALESNHGLLVAYDRQNQEEIHVLARYPVPPFATLEERYHIAFQPALAAALKAVEQKCLKADDGQMLSSVSELLNGSPVGPVLLQPLIVDQQILGAAMIAREPDDEAFSEEDRTLAQALATQVALLLATSRLGQQLQEAIASLQQAPEEELRLRQGIIDALSEGFLLANAAGAITMVNPAAETMLNQNGRQLLGVPLRKVLEGATLMHRVETDRHDSDEWILECGDHDLQIRRIPIRQPDGKRLATIAILHTVAATEPAGEELLTPLSALVHDLRTQFTSVTGLSELLAQSVERKLDLEQRRLVASIRESIRRVVELMDSLSTLPDAKQGPIEPRYAVVDLEKAILAASMHHDMLAKERKVTLHLDVPPDLPKIEADRNHLRLILNHLLRNAIRLSVPGKSVTVQVEANSDPSAADQGFAILHIRDQGLGIDRNDLPYIFDRTSGFGMGLHLVKKLVEAHQGRVWVDSELGYGSTFTVVLPFHHPYLATAPEPEITPQQSVQEPVSQPLAVGISPFVA
jgi:signal transduction histidine kinase